jgi:molybdate transport system substrate-binding protein
MPTLRFVSAGAAQGLVSAVARAADVSVEGSFGAVGAMLDKYRAGDACDIVILTHAQVTALAAEARIDARACADLGAVPTSVAVRTGERAPVVKDAESLRAAFLAAESIYVPDTAKSTAGGHVAKVLERLGLGADAGGRLRMFPNGATAMRTMAASKDKAIGCTQSTEIVATPGVQLVAPLPRGLNLETVYTAAVNVAGRQAPAAAFLQRLAGWGSHDARAAAGFGGYAIRPVTPADFAAIRALVLGTLHDLGLKPDPAGTDRDLDDPIAHYVRRGGTFDVAIDAHGRFAGCCGLYPHGDGTCELRKMYLEKDARGHGVGKRLLERALAFARGLGFRRVELETASVLERAIAMYTAAGFRPLERAPETARCDQAYALDLQ